jgi:predicted nucleotidyltransferase
MAVRERNVDSERLRALIAARRNEMGKIFARYGASDVKLFGSVARGDARSDSDIDLMVTIDAPEYEQVVSMLGMAEELTELLGRKVDVVARGVAKDHVADAAIADMVGV